MTPPTRLCIFYSQYLNLVLYWIFRFYCCSNYVVFNLLLLTRKALECIKLMMKDLGDKPYFPFRRGVIVRRQKEENKHEIANITDLQPFQHELNYVSQEKVIWPLWGE